MLLKEDLSNLSDEPHLWRFATQLSEQGYAHKTIVRYIAVAKRFLAYLTQRNVAIGAATPADVESYLRKELRRFRRLRQRLPTALSSWHHKRTAPIHLLLRTAQRDWPPVAPPSTPLELFHQQLLDGCARWLADCRGLAAQTIVARRGQWQQFLNWLDERGSQERLSDLSVADLDAYLQFRAQSVRRSTRAELALGLRSFISYLYYRGLLPRDLSQTITGPTPAPHVPLRMGSSLYLLIQRLLGKAGVTLEGKRGPHTFRHARAVSLLRAAVPLKAIGDILGHRSAASTRPYLKLATEDLRAVGLEVPRGVKP
jgi:site-specific recombinase XerD